MERSFRAAVVICLVLAAGLSGCASVADYRIAGRVVDSATGKPVAGAAVSEGAYAQDLAAGAVTGDDGTFAYYSYPEEHNVRVAAPGYAPGRTTVGLGPDASGVWLDVLLLPAQ
jgi:uncharacterized protein YceK